MKWLRHGTKLQHRHHWGRPQRYSDLAITTVLVIKRVFRLILRTVQGFIDSNFCPNGLFPCAARLRCSGSWGSGHSACIEQNNKGRYARKRAYCQKTRPLRGCLPKNWSIQQSQRKILPTTDTVITAKMMEKSPRKIEQGKEGIKQPPQTSEITNPPELIRWQCT